MSDNIEKYHPLYKYLELGDYNEIVKISKAKGLNKGHGYSYSYVKQVLLTERFNQSIIEIAKSIIIQRLDRLCPELEISNSEE